MADFLVGLIFGGFLGVIGEALLVLHWMKEDENG